MPAERKERPILFSGPMVRAILAGRKTMTRRLLKPQPEWIAETAAGTEPYWRLTGYEGRIDPQPVYSGPFDPAEYAADGHNWFPRGGCPYGVPGDRLWVRETWAKRDDLRTADPGTLAMAQDAFYRADYPAGLWHDDHEPLRWRSPILIPRRRSRITLDITDVRCGRLQEIATRDVCREGYPAPSLEDRLTPEAHGALMSLPIERRKMGLQMMPADGWRDGDTPKPRDWFAAAWDAINGKRATWESNPWVWCISFGVTS